MGVEKYNIIKKLRVVMPSGIAALFHLKEAYKMAVFRIEKTKDYTVMSNYHLRDRALSRTRPTM